jgi:hypothetical protein
MRIFLRCVEIAAKTAGCEGFEHAYGRCGLNGRAILPFQSARMKYLRPKAGGRT